MAIEKQSFLSNLVGQGNYDEYKGYARKIIPVGSCILGIVLLLSFFLHWGFIGYLLDSVTGTSLLFIVYVASLVLALDVEVDVEVREPDTAYGTKSVKKGTTYTLTTVWGVVLIVLGILAIYFSEKYRDNYAFECDTFLVDRQKGIYHFDWDNDCSKAAESENLEKMKGYEMDESYTLCKWCEQWAEDAEEEYESNRSFRM